MSTIGPDLYSSVYTSEKQGSSSLAVFWISMMQGVPCW